MHLANTYTNRLALQYKFNHFMHSLNQTQSQNCEKQHWHWHIFKMYDALNSCHMAFLNGRPILTIWNPGCQIYVFYYFFLLIWIYYIINSVTIFTKKLAINFWRFTDFYCRYHVSLKNNIKKIYGSFSMQLYITYYPILQQYIIWN